MDRPEEQWVEAILRWGATVEAAELIPPGRTLRLGSDWVAADAPAAASAVMGLVVPSANGPVLVVPTDAHALAFVDGVLTPIPRGDDGLGRIVIGPGTLVRLGLGPLTIDLRGVERPGPLASPRAERFDGALATSAFAHGLMLVIFLMQPPRAAAITLDRDDGTSREVRARLETSRSESETAPHGARGEVTVEDPTPAGARGTPVRGRAPIARRRTPSAGPSAEVSRAPLVFLARALASSAPNAPSPFAAIGPDADALAALQLDGPGGLGMRGTGRGTGGGGGGTIDLDGLGFSLGVTCTEGDLRELTARLGTERATELCSANNPGIGSGYGSGSGVFHSRCGGEHGHPCIVPGPLRICGSWSCTDDGGLSREAIRRVVSRHRGEVRACYERGLVTQPSLAGRVSASWVVTPSGAVTGASIDPAGSDLRSTQVEQCIAGAISRWGFPESDRATVVTYPFVLTVD